MKAATKLFYEFGEFRLDTEKRRLLREGEIIGLTRKSYETLKALVERPGLLVEREQLMDLVWRDTTVEPGNLDVAIFKLRKALAENENGNKFIETVPRLGYKFVASVREVVENLPVAIVEKETRGRIVIDEEISLGRRTDSSSASRLSLIVPKRVVAAGAVGLAVVLALGIFTLVWRGRSTSASTASAPAIKSIAVLPFKTINSAQEGSHQGLGVAEILITRLSNLRQINVRPTNAVMGFENSQEDSLSIAKRLQVDAFLEGTIYRVGDKVRLSGRFTRVSDQAVLWSGQFERLAEDELQLQNEVALQIVSALTLNLSGNEKDLITKRYTASPDAYQLYLEGRYHWNKRNYEGLAQAQRLFRNAIAEDPDFALAYVGLADSLAFSNDPWQMSDALSKALELDPNLAEAHATAGFLNTVHFWNWQRAEVAFKKAIELNPNCVTAHHWYAIFLEIQGRYEEAKLEIRRALQINPLSYNLLADLGQIYYFARDYENAKEYCRRALEIYPDFAYAHAYLADTYAAMGEYEMAIAETARSENLLYRENHQQSDVAQQLKTRLAEYRQIYARGGIKKFREFRLDLIEQTTSHANPNLPYERARLFALLGRKAEALENLEKGLEIRPFLMAWLKADPVFDNLRAEPRFQTILLRMNLPADPQ